MSAIGAMDASWTSGANNTQEHDHATFNGRAIMRVLEPGRIESTDSTHEQDSLKGRTFISPLGDEDVKKK